MAIDPAAAGAPGLAAAAAGVGAGGTAEPVENVRSIFTMPGMTITHHYGIINAHNLTGMDNFDYIRVNDYGSFINICNDT